MIRYRPGVTAVIPCLPGRRETLLARAMSSVMRQTRPVEAVSLAVDLERNGAADTRNQALEAVRTEWTAFLDDDDEWYPDHVRSLAEHAEDTTADMVYPWFDVPEGWDPFPDMEGQPFRPAELDRRNWIPVTVLIRTEMILDIGGFRPKGPPDNPCEDWATWLAVRDAGQKIEHFNGRTWAWHWHKGNTSGKGAHW